MTYRIRCTTRFDITATGVRSHYKESRMPFRDDSGQLIENSTQWNRARNQQRNWETLNQIISLRTLPQEISQPTMYDDMWCFEFSIPAIETVALDDEPTGLLLRDCDGVPMIVGLNETVNLDPVLVPGANIAFMLLD